MRKALAESGLLDRSRKILSDDAHVYLPILEMDAIISDKLELIAPFEPVQIDFPAEERPLAPEDILGERWLGSELAGHVALVRIVADGLREVAALPDPVGEVLGIRRRPNGMEVGKMRVPIGLIGIIYESRPNVTADTAALCLKSGNAVILRGGSEAVHSNTAIVHVLSAAGAEAGIPAGAVSFIENPDRACVMEMLKLNGIIDLIIPRGGEGLIRMVSENSTIPVIKHDKGVCHVYVDSKADLSMAEEICFNAKVQRPGTCNAMEAMLVHQDVARMFLPAVINRMKKAGVEIRGDAKTRAIVPDIKEATEKDWDTEYNDLILNVKTVVSMEDAMEHIAAHGSQHSEAIVTNDYRNAHRFQREVDASAVFVNASTRLNDGFEFGDGSARGGSLERAWQ